jgi:nucleotide sugar dehydrogenase
MVGIGLDSRIGSKFLNPGVGWGGSCFGKDIQALLHTAGEYGYEGKLLAASLEVNKSQRQMVIQKLQEKLYILKGRTIGLLGLAFKPDTDDLRDAPALHIAERLMQSGAGGHLHGFQIQLPGLAAPGKNQRQQRLYLALDLALDGLRRFFSCAATSATSGRGRWRQIFSFTATKARLSC